MSLAKAIGTLNDLVGRLESHLRHGHDRVTIDRLGQPILLIRFEDPENPGQSITNLLHHNS